MAIDDETGREASEKKPVGAGDLGRVISLARQLATDVRNANWSGVANGLFGLLDELRASLSAAPIQLTQIPAHAAGNEQACAAALDAWCEENEKKAQQSGSHGAEAFPWATLLPILLQIVQMWLSRQA